MAEQITKGLLRLVVDVYLNGENRAKSFPMST